MKTLNQLGFDLEFHNDKLCVVVEGEQLRVEMHEPSKLTAMPKADKWGHRRRDYTPSGRISFKLWSHYLYGYQSEWTDGAKKNIEERLVEIVGFVLKAPKIIADKNQQQHKEEHVRERRRLCEQRRIDTYKKLRSRAETMNEFVNELKSADAIRELMIRAADATTLPVATERLLRWASIYVDHLDPLLDFRLEKLDCDIPDSRRGFGY